MKIGQTLARHVKCWCRIESLLVRDLLGRQLQRWPTCGPTLAAAASPLLSHQPPPPLRPGTELTITLTHRLIRPAFSGDCVFTGHSRSGWPRHMEPPEIPTELTARKKSVPPTGRPDNNKLAGFIS